MIPLPEMPRLLLRARAGCRRSFGRLWSEHVQQVRVVVRRSLRGNLVDDVVQDVAAAALTGIGSLRGEDPATFVAWLCTIARNRARRALALAHRNRELVCEQSDVDALATVGDDPSGPLHRREVRDVLRRLPRCYRLPLRLHFLRGHTGPEIASLLGMSQGSVRVCLCRGLRRLREGMRRFPEDFATSEPA